MQKRTLKGKGLLLLPPDEADYKSVAYIATGGWYANLEQALAEVEEVRYLDL